MKRSVICALLVLASALGGCTRPSDITEGDDAAVAVVADQN